MSVLAVLRFRRPHEHVSSGAAVTGIPPWSLVTVLDVQPSLDRDGVAVLTQLPDVLDGHGPSRLVGTASSQRRRAPGAAWTSLLTASLPENTCTRTFPRRSC